jgi:glycosyltransferase involved in cell wall biosynthesis
MRRPRLLFLCQTLPYPPDGGVWIRTYHVLRLLSQAFDITALCFERAASAGQGIDWNAATGPDALGRFADVEVFAIPQKHSRVRYLWDHLRSVASGRVYTSYLYESRAFRSRIKQLLRSNRYDLVHADSLDLAAYLPACSGLPVVCVHHDVESALLRRRAAVERSRSRRSYLQLQAGLMEEVERHWCGRVALNVAVSKHDATLLQRTAPGCRVSVVPNGVDAEEFHPDGEAGSGVAYVGGTTPFPNRDALEFFCDQILPSVRTLVGDISVRWIGRASPEEQQEYRDRFGIELTGYVEDVRPLMRQAACHIVPLRTGGGTRLKILNSWAMGKPVVATSVGCEGLEAIDGTNILIRDNPNDFATAVRAVLENPRLRQRLSDGARETVDRLYSWDVLGRELIETYLTATHAWSRDAAPAIPVGGRPRYGHS